MNELIKITEKEGKRVVSARELHKFLEASERFSAWAERQLQYGFIENVDYVGCKEFNTLANQELTDYALTIETAKHWAMMQRSEKGMQIRNYFIECEKKLQSKTPAIPQTFAEALQLAADQAKQLESQNKAIEEMKPKAIFADSVSASTTSILIGDLAKIIKQNGYDIGQKRLFKWLRDNKYLISRAGSDYNSPTQTSMDKGLFFIKETAITHADGHITINKTVKVTGVGQIYFINKFFAKNLHTPKR